MSSFSRREFLARSAAVAGGVAVLPELMAAPVKDPLLQDLAGAVVAQQGVLRPQGVEKKDPLKFAEIAKKDYGIDAIEYVNQFYKDKKKDDAYLKDLKKVADDNRGQERPHHVRRRGEPRQPGREGPRARRSRTTSAGSSGRSSSAATASA